MFRKRIVLKQREQAEQFLREHNERIKNCDAAAAQEDVIKKDAEKLTALFPVSMTHVYKKGGVIGLTILSAIILLHVALLIPAVKSALHIFRPDNQKPQPNRMQSPTPPQFPSPKP